MYVVEFEANTPQERSLIGNLVHLDGMNGNIVFSVLNEHDLETVENQLPFLLGQVTPSILMIIRTRGRISGR